MSGTNASPTFRRATTDDLDRLIEIHMASYPDSRGVDARRRNFMANPRGSLEDLCVALLGDTLVGHAFLFSFEAWFGGRGVKTSGVASVGVAPEARGRGVASALLAHLHDQGLARGDAISLLFPFREDFYARAPLVYAPVSPSKKLDVSPRAIPRSWAESATRVRAATGADREKITNAYARAAARATGWLSRTEAIWDAAFLDERRDFFVAERGDAVVGYVAWWLAQEEPHAPTQLRVREIVADDDEARRALFGLIGSQRDQVLEVSLDVADDDPIGRAFVDADRTREGSADLEHPLGTVVGGPMVRILDVARALEARGYAADGSLDLAIAGEPAVHLEVRGGSARVAKTAASAPSIALDRRTLAAIAFGALRPSDAARLGWLTSPDPRTLTTADALFALPSFFAIDPF